MKDTGPLYIFMKCFTLHKIYKWPVSFHFQMQKKSVLKSLNKLWLYLIYDIDLIGVARAFDDTVFPHPDIVKLCTEYWGADSLDSPKMKLAMVNIYCLEYSGVNSLMSLDFYYMVTYMIK